MGSLENDKKKLELVHVAIHQLLEERKEEKEKGNEDDESLLLSKLLSQLDTLEKDAHATSLMKCPLEKNEAPLTTTEAPECGVKEGVLDEVVKELKSMKRQNRITHCLLSVMIVITAVWQFSEASLLMNMKKTVSHPIRSVGDMITNTLKGKEKFKREAKRLTTVDVPELPHIDLPSFQLDVNED